MNNHININKFAAIGAVIVLSCVAIPAYAGEVRCENVNWDNLDIVIKIPEPPITVSLDGTDYHAEPQWMTINASLEADGNYEHYIELDMNDNTAVYTSRQFGGDDADEIKMENCTYKPDNPDDE